MNANELDKKLVEVAKFIDSVANNWQAIRIIESTRTILRQQQSEIEALKIKYDVIAHSSCSCGFIKRGKAQEK